MDIAQYGIADTPSWALLTDFFRLFDIIKDYDRSVPIAQLAEEHHQLHGRALRVAVDEADWRFNNLTEAQVYTIRDTSDQAFQGQEKRMFYRICRFLTLNIQLVFVFDGPGRPWKRGKHGSGKIDYRKRDLLQEVLRALGIPYHEAPGEAEAECARMQALGMVDAVWSQDSDCLMLGCTTWIRDDRIVKQKGTNDRSKENTEKSKKTARVVRAADLKTRLQIDREGLVLFAMLVGGDYDIKGLPGCGPSVAMKILKKGLECVIWSGELQEALATSNARGIRVPTGFPDFKILQKYNNPKVTSDSVLKSNARLNLDCVRPINELKLLETTSSRFNIWVRLYMNWVGPVLLTRSITDRDPSLPLEVIHGITITKTKAKKTGDEAVPHVFERKVRFSPFGISSLRRRDFEGERLGYWNGDTAKPFDPEHRVECEIPNYWLSKLLPPDVLDPPPPKPKRRQNKRDAPIEPSETLEVPISKKRKQTGRDITSTVAARLNRSPDMAHTISASIDLSYSMATPTQKRRWKVSTVPAHKVIELSDSEDELRLPPSRTRTTFAPRSTINTVVHFGSPSSSVDSVNLLQFARTTKQSGPANPSRMEQSDTSGSITKPVQGAPPIAQSLNPISTRKSLQPAMSTIPASPLIDLASASAPRLATVVPVANTELSFNTQDGSTQVLKSSVRNIEAVRAARVRHFQEKAPSSIPVLPLSSLMSNSNVANRHIEPAFIVPQGVDCVDLTDD